MSSGPDGILSPAAAEMVERGDLDRLTVHVSELANAQEWDQLEVLRDCCRIALERGKQLWAVASYIEYRLCLDAPAAWAARALETATGRFALGPLPEVAASSHVWRELAQHLHATPQAALVAHERVVRGEDLSADTAALGMPPALDLPLQLAAWEPSYSRAEYKADKVEAPAPRVPRLRRLEPVATGGGAGPPLGRNTSASSRRAREVTAALEELAATWTTESNGRAEAVAVVGDALDAVRALGAHPVEMVQLSPQTALALMGWAGASSGAHGRRRGAAAGRFGAWGVLAALAGVADDWAANEQRLSEAAGSTSWYAWGGGEPVTGWSLRLALGSTPHHAQPEAFALTAVDAF